MNKEPEPQSQKPQKGKIFRNIWFVSMAVFIISLVGMGVTIINDKNGSFDGVGVFALVFATSIVIGSTSFIIWVYKIGNSVIKNILKFLGILTGSIFLLLVLWIIFFRYAIVDGGSMEPSYKNGDIYLVSKFAYRSDDPKRGDVVDYSLIPGSNEQVGRVIGLPGETISIKSGEIKINNEVLDEPYANWDKWTDVAVKEISLKENEYFILYDKRSWVLLSVDGELVPVKSENIVGKFTFKLFSK